MLTVLLAATLGLTPFNYEAPEAERLAFALDRANPVDERIYAVWSFLRTDGPPDQHVTADLWELARSGEVELQPIALLAIAARGDAQAIPALIRACTKPVSDRLARHRGSRFCSERLVGWRMGRIASVADEAGIDLAPVLLERYDPADTLGKALIMQAAADLADARFRPLLPSALSPDYWNVNWLIGYHAVRLVQNRPEISDTEIEQALERVEAEHWLPFMRRSARIALHLLRVGTLEEGQDRELDPFLAEAHLAVEAGIHFDGELSLLAALRGWEGLPIEWIVGAEAHCPARQWQLGGQADPLNASRPYGAPARHLALEREWMVVQGTNFGEWGGTLTVDGASLPAEIVSERLNVIDLRPVSEWDVLVTAGTDHMIRGLGTIDRLRIRAEHEDHRTLNYPYRLERVVSFPGAPVEVIEPAAGHLIVIGRSWALSVRNGKIEGYLPCAVSSTPMDAAD